MIKNETANSSVMKNDNKDIWSIDIPCLLTNSFVNAVLFLNTTIEDVRKA